MMAGKKAIPDAQSGEGQANCRRQRFADAITPVFGALDQNHGKPAAGE
jgi:hypothetical protein